MTKHMKICFKMLKKPAENIYAKYMKIWFKMLKNLHRICQVQEKLLQNDT